VSAQYEAGVCNIGGAERRKRRRYAGVAFGVAAAYLLVVLVSSLPTLLLAGLFVPLSVGFEMALQARRAFCVSLALSGEYAFDDESGPVSAADARATDRAAGLKLAALGLGGGAVTTGLVYAVVSLV